MKISGTSVAAVVRSRTFFIVTLTLFIFESVWIALSARYPMAFDEDYHLGLIKLFAHQWSPLLLHQPPGAAPFGAVARNPSYLYHWLMSFPYRWLIASFNEQTTVIVLRFLNIAFFAGGLVFFRRLLLKAKLSRGVVQTALFFFVLVPVAPLLAGQINYDNLLMLFMPINLLMVLRFREQLLKKRLNIALLVSAFSLALLGSLEQFPYLPVLTAIVLYLLYLLWLWQFARLPRHKFWRDVKRAWAVIPNVQRVAVASLLAVSVGLFVEMYGVNIVKYHNLTPQCGQVLSVGQCMSYGPWARNYAYTQQVKQHGRPSNFSSNPAVFLGGWLQGMFLRSFFAINGTGGPAPYENFKPLPLISFAAMLTLGFGFLLSLRYGRAILRGDPVLLFLLFVSFVYIVSLLAKNYYDYLQLGRLTAINGRYLFPVILPIMAVIGMAYRRFLSENRQALLLSAACLLFLQGGGATTFIVQSNAAWYWPNDRFAIRINQDAQKILNPLILGWPKEAE